MIISLFMDETPVVCGSDHSLGARDDVRPPDQTRRRGDAQREHDEDAEKIHV
jgi:hypothetical protein